MDLSNYKIILFDHDDTLVSSFLQKWRQHRYIAKEFYDIELTDDDLRHHWGKPMSQLFKALYLTDNIDMAMSYTLATREMFPKKIFPHTIRVLNDLKTRGFTLGIVTATSSINLKHDLEKFKFPKKLFEYVQTEDDTLFHKPDPRVFEPVYQWIQQNKTAPSQVLYVGDHVRDMSAALGADFHFIAVTTGSSSKTEFVRRGIVTIDSLEELIS
jgi:phosphoglycolate phosphatase-like HAD superfamily hydrolase